MAIDTSCPASQHCTTLLRPVLQLVERGEGKASGKVRLQLSGESPVLMTRGCPTGDVRVARVRLDLSSVSCVLDDQVLRDQGKSGLQ